MWALIDGGSSVVTILAALFGGGAGQLFVHAFRDRKGIRTDPTEISVARAQVGAVVRCGAGDTDEIVVLDRRGRVRARAHGTPAELFTARRTLDVPVARLPEADSAGRFFLAIALPAVAATLAGLINYSLHRTAFGIAGVLFAAWPFLLLLPRRAVEVAVDGLSFVSLTGARHFVSFADIASLDHDGETLLVTRTDGGEERFTFAHEGSMDEVLRRWTAHTKKREAPRQRVVDTGDEEVALPYRVRVDDAELLAEAVLDSAESREVRVRAAKKLVRIDVERAKAVEEQIVDPEVCDAIRGTSEPAGSPKR